MPTKDIDEILNRLFLDRQFRQQIRNDLEQALVGY